MEPLLAEDDQSVVLDRPIIVAADEILNDNPLVQGKVVQAKVLRSIPLLDAAAIDAVRQWEYEPTLVDGAAVPLIATVTVNFVLQ